MDDNQRRVFQWSIVTVVLVLLIVFGYFLLERTNQLACPDGSRRVRINSKGFETQYSANTVKLEAELKQSGKLSAELGSTQLLQMSEAVQLARLHLQALSEGYNACAVSPMEFNESRNRFQRMEDLAGEINSLNAKETLTSSDHARLKQLTIEYIALVKAAGSSQ